MLDLFVFLLIVLVFVVVLLWLVTKLPPPISEIAWILQILVVGVAIIAVLAKFLPMAGVSL